uniref:SHS2 domain-containing protein n=1 Tax=Panagrolaimus sp. JU765 TaxID=591449 RepID=A0AC34Q247_9BILA
MSVSVGIFTDHELAESGTREMSVYDQTTDEFDTKYLGDELDMLIFYSKAKFKEKLENIYVVSVESSNYDFDLMEDIPIQQLTFDDLDFTNYSPTKLTPETKIVVIDDSSILYEYVNSENGILKYKPVKCFEARLDKENHLKLMLQLFECDLNQLHFFIHRSESSDLDYLEIIKKEKKDFSSYTMFNYRCNSERAVIYGRYLTNDNVQSLLKLPYCFHLNEIELNTLNFKVNQVIPSFRAIDTYKPETRLMGIDLGSSRTVVCVSRNGRAELVKIDKEYSMPSVISFAEDKPIIGNVAKRHLAKYPELVLSDLKELRDTKRDMSSYVYMNGFTWLFGHCIETNKSSFIFQSKELIKQISTIEIYQILLQKLKQEASEYQFDLNEGKDVNQAVITVPNFDNQLMLNDILKATESAGLKIIDIITGKQFCTACCS